MNRWRSCKVLAKKTKKCKETTFFEINWGWRYLDIHIIVIIQVWSIHSVGMIQQSVVMDKIVQLIWIIAVCFIVLISYGGFFYKLIEPHHLFGNICEHVSIEKLVHSKEWTEIAHLHSLRKDENHIPNHCWKKLRPVWGGCNLLGLYVFLKTGQPMLKLHCVAKKAFAMIWSSGQVSSYLRQCINQSERL